jgi:hypothetical protein
MGRVDYHAGGLFEPAIGLGMLMLLAAGCGGPETGTIAGTVTYQGQHLAGGFVDFVSEQGQVVTGRIESDGSYVVAGVPIGVAKISVRDLSGALGGTSAASRLKLPLRYRSAAESGLRYSVSAGRQHHDLALQD